MQQSTRRPQTSDTSGDPTIFARAPVQGRQDIPRRRTAPPAHTITHYQTPPDEDAEAVQVIVKHKGRYDWLLPVGIVALLLLGGSLFWNGIVLPGWEHLSSQWHYGDARTSAQTITIDHRPREVLAIGYHGKLVVLLLANPQDTHSQATEYIAPQYFPDEQSRAITVRVQDVNHDGIPDLIIHVVESTEQQSVDPVLYGKADGTFSWTPPAQKGE